MRMTDDATLVSRARDGDADSFAELVRRYQDIARRVAAATGGVDIAEDAAQEGFVRAFGALATFRDDRAFRPWLLSIVANAARNHRRAHTRWDRARLRAVERDASVATASPEETIEARDTRRSLARAIDALPRAHREVVACRYLMDLSEQETAACLGVPTGTVKSRLARALDRLEVILRKELARD
jgi:RNA polymerase sigma-70 factor (ECF subfamily)